jgi:hypothetical protein
MYPSMKAISKSKDINVLNDENDSVISDDFDPQIDNDLN